MFKLRKTGSKQCSNSSNKIMFGISIVGTVHMAVTTFLTLQKS